MTHQPLSSWPRRPSISVRVIDTLGIAYYRVGHYADAVAQLQKSLVGDAGKLDAANLYFLAMCYHKVGDAIQATDCYTRAKAWHEKQAQSLSPEEAEELQRFRAEAEGSLAKSPGR